MWFEKWSTYLSLFIDPHFRILFQKISSNSPIVVPGQLAFIKFLVKPPCLLLRQAMLAGSLPCFAAEQAGDGTSTRHSGQEKPWTQKTETRFSYIILYSNMII